MSKIALQIAQEHAASGYAPVVVAFQGKNPIETEWQTRVIAYEDLPTHFKPDGGKLNVGLLWGAPSRNRGDVDLDCWEARGLAAWFLPPTDARFGRVGAPNSHWVYAFTDGCPDGIYHLIDPDAPQPKPGDHKARIIELRGNRHQTVGPGSINETGEQVRWDSKGEPAEVEAGAIERAVHKIAAATLIVRRWTPGLRTELALPLAGALLRGGWSEQETADFLIAVNTVAPEGEDDERTRKRLRGVVAGTSGKLRAGERVCGLPRLAELIGKKEVSDRFAQWLGLGTTGPQQEDDHRTGHRQQEQAGAADGEQPWPARSELPTAPVAPPLPARELLPVGLRAYVLDAARLASVPAEYVAVPLVAALAGLVGRAVGVRPEAFSDWLVVPNLWGAIVGPPGWLKSLALSEGMRPLERLAARARARAAEQRGQDEARVERLEAALEGTKAAMRKAAEQDAAGKGKPGELDRLQGEWADRKAERDKLRAQAHERRYVTQDPTVQKLGALLQENPRGLLVVRDELAGWLHSLDKPGSEGDRQFYLEAWNGTGGYTVDRIGRGTVHISALTVSVLGGIQPGKLMPHVAGAEAGKELADGLLQRFQLLVWPDTLGDFHKPSRWPDADARAAVAAIFERLDGVDELLPADVARDGDSGIPALRFDAAAQQVFDAWRAELEGRLRTGALRDAPAFESHLSKYRSLMPSLALLFHLVEVAQDACPRTDSGASSDTTHPKGTTVSTVSAGAARLAAAWCAFLELHAAKLYDAELRPGVAAAQALADKIQAGAIRDGAAVRDIYRHHWTGLTTAGQVAAGLAVLETAHWVRLEEGRVSERGGQFADRVRLHPDLRPHGDGKEEQ